MADPVNFTRPAAERIARAVRVIEFGSRDGSGPAIDRPWDSGPRFKLTLATFTGDWQTSTYKTVTYSSGTTTATAQVYNWCNPAMGGDTSSTTKTRYVIFGKVSGTNSAVEIQMPPPGTCTMQLGPVDLRTLTGYDSEAIQVLGHNSSGPCLQWYSVSSCSTAT